MKIENKFYLHFFFSKIVPCMRQCGKIIAEVGRSQMTASRMLIACWIPKAKNKHSDYVIFITFPVQQWLHERAWMLCCWKYCRNLCTENMPLTHVDGLLRLQIQTLWSRVFVSLFKMFVKITTVYWIASGLPSKWCDDKATGFMTVEVCFTVLQGQDTYQLWGR